MFRIFFVRYTLPYIIYRLYSIFIFKNRVLILIDNYVIQNNYINTL